MIQRVSINNIPFAWRYRADSGIHFQAADTHHKGKLEKIKYHRQFKYCNDTHASKTLKSAPKLQNPFFVFFC